MLKSRPLLKASKAHHEVSHHQAACPGTSDHDAILTSQGPERMHGGRVQRAWLRGAADCDLDFRSHTLPPALGGCDPGAR